MVTPMELPFNIDTGKFKIPNEALSFTTKCRVYGYGQSGDGPAKTLQYGDFAYRLGIEFEVNNSPGRMIITNRCNEKTSTCGVS